MAHITDTDTVIAFDQRAVQTIQRMGDHVATLRSFYGEHSAEHGRAAASLAHSLQAMIGLGRRVSQDGQLALYAVSAIHYGVVFHAGAVPHPPPAPPVPPNPANGPCTRDRVPAGSSPARRAIAVDAPAS